MTLVRQALLAWQGLATAASDASGTGVGLVGFLGPRPPNDTTGNAKLTATDYTFVASIDGTDAALFAPTSVFYTFEAARDYDTIKVWGWYKVGSLAATQRVIGLGSATNVQIALEITTAGKWRVSVLASGGATWTDTGASVVLNQVVFYEFAARIDLTNGAFRLEVDGDAVTDLVKSGVDTQAGASGSGMTGFNVNSAVGTYSPIAVDACDGGFDADEFEGISHISVLGAASSGSYRTFYQCGDGVSQDAFCDLPGEPASPGSGNYTYVDDASSDQKASWLRTDIPNDRESWIMGALPALAGSISRDGVQTVVADWCDTDDEYFNVHFLRRDGIIHEHPDNGAFEWVGVGNQVQYGSRLWPSDPGGRGWTVANVSGLEIGVRNNGASGVYGVSHALLFVAWTEAVAETPTTDVELEAECDPCATPIGAWYVDSGVEYNGENSVDGGTTTSTAPLTLGLSPGADWTTVGLSHTLTNAASLFSSGMVGKAFRLGTAAVPTPLDPTPTPTSVIVDVTAYANANSITVTNRTAVPTSLQGVATTTWALMAKTMTGLDHLEDEVVYANADGLKVGPFTVASGSVTFDDHAAVAITGLLYDMELHTLDVDFPADTRGVNSARKLISRVSVLASKSRQLEIGQRDPVKGEVDYGTSPSPKSFLKAGDAPNALRSGRVTFPIRSAWDGVGGIGIRSSDPLPLHILTITPEIDAAGKVAP